MTLIKDTKQWSRWSNSSYLHHIHYLCVSKVQTLQSPEFQAKFLCLIEECIPPIHDLTVNERVLVLYGRQSAHCLGIVKIDYEERLKKKIDFRFWIITIVICKSSWVKSDPMKSWCVFTIPPVTIPPLQAQITIPG